MTDATFVDDVTFNAESCGDQLVCPGGRYRVGIRVVLHNDRVSLAAMGFKDSGQLGGFAYGVGAARLCADVGEGSTVSGHVSISFHSAQRRANESSVFWWQLRPVTRSNSSLKEGWAQQRLLGLNLGGQTSDVGLADGLCARCIYSLK